MEEILLEKFSRLAIHDVFPSLAAMSSRLHAWQWRGQRYWVKREDELGGLGFGSKLRKLCGLLAEFREEQAEVFLALGSQRSSFLLCLLQKSKELGLSGQFLVKRSAPAPAFDWSQCLADWWQSDEMSLILERSQWPQRMQVLAARQQYYEQLGKKVYLIEEGGAQWAGFWGALTLAYDLSQQLTEFPCDEIWCDAGTGTTAMALILGLRLLEIQKPVHVVLCAGTPADFMQQLQVYQQALTDRWDLPLRAPLALTLHQPYLARSFGAVNQSLLAFIEEVASSSGLLLDPIYNAKLFYKAVHTPRASQARALVIHSGGVPSLYGFARPSSRRSE